MSNSQPSHSGLPTHSAASQPDPMIGIAPGVNGFAPGPNDRPAIGSNADHSPADQAASTGAADTATLGRPAWLTSLIVRRRNSEGDILPYSFSYEVPLIDDVPIAQTSYDDAVRIIQGHDPERAHALRAFYDRRLLPALRRLHDARAEAEEKLRRDLHEAHTINQTVEEQQTRIQRERDAALGPFVTLIEETEDALSQAHRHAAQAMARCGQAYNPANPDASAVLRHEREPLEAIAADLNEAWTPGDAAKRLPKWATFALTALTGAVLGVSLGLMGEFYATDELTLRPWIVLGFCVGGIGVATLAGEGIKLFFKAVSERIYRHQSRSQWSWLLGAGVAVGALIVVIDSYVERSGLMSKVFETQLTQSLNRNVVASGISSSEQVMFFLAGMILSLPLVLCYGWHGYLDGRYDVCRNRMIAEQERRFAAKSRWLREDGATQQALDAVSQVRDSIRHLELMHGRMAQAARPFEREMALWEAKRLPELRELDQMTKFRLQDLLANVHGAQIEWDRAMDAARGVPLWHLSFGQRLRLLLGLSPYPARVQRLPRNRK
ncbi:MAG: hypothetical protein JWN98_2446 [Abditibacteriota bacterium]|nr:hypothetical protein [Abditibacteriota bacterium]